MASISEQALREALAEHPQDNASLWVQAWGGKEGVPSVVTKLVDDLETARNSRTALVYGRYGTGKSSLMRVICNEFSEKHGPIGGSENKVDPVLWLHMPTVANGIGSTALAAIVHAIADHLSPLRKSKDLYKRDSEGQEFDKILKLFYELEHRVNSGFYVKSFQGEKSNPGHVTCIYEKDTNKANTIEYAFDALLGWKVGTFSREKEDSGNEQPHRLLVAIDDLDRCEKGVAMDIIRLLLRFGNVRGIHFIIACDRDILEGGVREWMERNGTSGAAGPMVTASSAIEKYLHYQIELPELGQVVGKTSAESPLPDDLELPAVDAPPGQEILADLWIRSVLKDAYGSEASDGKQAEGRGESDREGAPLGGEPPENRPSTAGSKAGDVKAIQDNPDSFESFKENKNSVTNEQKTADPFMQALKQVLVKWDGNKIYFNEDYRSIIGGLTLRQLKSFLRDRLLGTVTEQDSSPQARLLRSLFPAFWELKHEDADLYPFITFSAQAALASSRGNRLGAIAAKRFFSQVQAVVETSSILGSDRLIEAWPRNSRERMLLVMLLAAVKGDNWTVGMISRPIDRASPRSDRVVPPSYAPVMASGRDDVGEEDTLAAVLVDFANWCERQIQQKPKGYTAVEQLSSFESALRNVRREGQTAAAGHIAAYADLWLDRHGRFLTSDAASILSNLAVIINDVPGLEGQCDRLFRKAVGLGGVNQSRITLYYCEFLLDAVTDQGRREILLKSFVTADSTSGELSGGMGAAEADVFRYVSGRLSQSSFSASDYEMKLYNDILLYRSMIGLNLDPSKGFSARSEIDLKNTTYEQFIEKVISNLAESNMDVFRASAREGNFRPMSRFDDFVDAYAGTFGSEFLRVVRTVFSKIWAALDADSLPSWTLRMQLANTLVGRSEASSLLERVGLRMNAGLLRDADLLQSRTERVGAIWSQSAALISQRIPKQKSGQRALLGMAIAALYSTEGQFYDRLGSMLEYFGKSVRNAGDLEGLLDEEGRKYYRSLSDDLYSIEAINSAVDYIFGDEYADDISTYFDFLKALSQ